jgi:hypothetical protein
VEIDQPAEANGRLPKKLEAPGVVVVTADRSAGEVVVDPVILLLDEEREAGGESLGQTSSYGSLQFGRAEGAVRRFGLNVGVLRRLLRLELHDAGRRVPSEQRSLRTAQHFDALDVEDRHPLEYRVLEDFFVIDHRNRLRSIEIEIGIAETSNVEAGEGPAERRLDEKTGYAA